MKSPTGVESNQKKKKININASYHRMSIPLHLSADVWPPAPSLQLALHPPNASGITLSKPTQWPGAECDPTSEALIYRKRTTKKYI